MSKELFENVGKDIKNLAKATANWILGAYILLGIVFIACGCALLSEGMAIGWIAFLIAFGLIAFGYSQSRLTVMRWYAYGEITDRLISIDSKMANDGKSDSHVGRKPVPKPAVKTPRRTGPWECQFCGLQNPPDVKYCKSCKTEDIEFN